MEAHPRSRLALRIALQLRMPQRDGTARTVEAATLIINKYGARIECGQAPGLNQMIELTVPGRGRTSWGRVIWLSHKRNDNEKREFVVEIGESESLWGITFPPPDSLSGSKQSAASL